MKLPNKHNMCACMQSFKQQCEQKLKCLNEVDVNGLSLMFILKTAALVVIHFLAAFASAKVIVALVELVTRTIPGKFKTVLKVTGVVLLSIGFSFLLVKMTKKLIELFTLENDYNQYISRKS